VLDLGAGSGAITAALAATGARVIAVERDPRLAARLRRRFDGDGLVRVVETDLRTIPFPRRDFLIVASPPFSLTTALCERLLSDPVLPLAGAELIVQREAARWLASTRPRDARTAWWGACYQIQLNRVLSPASFTPPPSVSAAWLSVRPRPARVPARSRRLLSLMLTAAYRRPATRAGIALAGHKRLLRRAGIDPAAPIADMTADQWHQLAVLLDGRAPAG
jgi:23S rRNA (adenine-N6)-dimethyltransferase